MNAFLLCENRDMAQWEYFTEFYTIKETMLDMNSDKGNHVKLVMTYHGHNGWEAYSVVHTTEPVDICLGDEPQLTEGYRVWY